MYRKTKTAIQEMKALHASERFDYQMECYKNNWYNNILQ